MPLEYCFLASDDDSGEAPKVLIMYGGLGALSAAVVEKRAYAIRCESGGKKPGRGRERAKQRPFP